MSDPSPTTPGEPFSRGPWLAPLAAGVLCFGVYGASLESGVGLADTAKFQLIGATLGTAHAPGYPVYVLLLHLASRLLPFLSWAASANLVSALAIAATVALLARSAEAMGAARLPTFAAATAFGMLPAIRNAASEAEVYPLHLQWIAGALFCLLRFRADRKVAWLVAACAFGSLGLSHHPTIVCSFPALLLLAGFRTLPWRRLLVWLPLFAVLALAPFAYVVWRTYAPATSAIEMQASSAAQLWDGLSGAQHRANVGLPKLETIVRERLPWTARNLWHNEGWLLALALLGFAARGNRRNRLAIAVLLAGNLGFTWFYTVPDLDVFLLPVHLGIGLTLALGLHRSLERIPSRAFSPLAAAAVAISPVLFGAAIPPRESPAIERETAAVVDAVPSNAVLVSFDYPRSMALQYQIWRRKDGALRLAAVPQAGLAVPLLTDRLRRHLSGGEPFRLGARDELVARGTPLVCYCPKEETRAALARQGLLTEPAFGPGLFQLRAAPAAPSLPQPLPAAVLVSRRISLGSLHEETAALVAPGFDPRSTLLRIGTAKEKGEERRPEGGAVVLRQVAPNALVADVTSPGGGWLVLTDLYTSRWRVLVDGRPARSFRADVLFLGLEVPAGAHRIEVRRDRRPFSIRRFWRGPWGYLLP